MRRTDPPATSREGRSAIDAYGRYLREEQDLSAPTLRNYLSDLRHFAAWCEGSWSAGEDEALPFDPTAVATPTITSYRSHLRTVLGLKPATVNRRLVTLKRYFGWARETGITSSDPAKAVKLVPSVPKAPRHLDDREEAALVAAVTRYGTPRDRALIVTALHTGLRAEELCGGWQVKTALRGVACPCGGLHREGALRSCMRVGEESGLCATGGAKPPGKGVTGALVVAELSVLMVASV